MTKLKWDRQSKENLDLRHKLKIEQGYDEYERTYVKPVPQQKTSADNPDESLVSCQICKSLVKSENIRKHHRKVHSTITSLGETNREASSTTTKKEKQKSDNQDFRLNIPLLNNKVLYLGVETQTNAPNPGKEWCIEAVNEITFNLQNNIGFIENTLELLVDFIKTIEHNPTAITKSFHVELGLEYVKRERNDVAAVKETQNG
jgi:hypothetical protein